MSLPRSSLEQSSIFYYLKDGVLASRFSQEVQNEPLSYNPNPDVSGVIRTDYKIVDPNLGAYGTLPVSAGRGWLSFELNQPSSCEFFDATTSSYVPIYNTPLEGGNYSIPSVRESSLVVVRDQYGDILPRDHYQIDYRRGRIRWPAPTTPTGSLGLIPTTVDYRFHMVSVVEGYPTDDTPAELPIVSIYPMTDKPDGLQIGPGVVFTRKYSIDIYANSPSELRELIDIIQDSFFNRSIPVIDFNRTGEPLEHWGVVNSRFIQEYPVGSQTYRGYLTLNPGNGNVLYFIDIEVLHSASPRQTRSNILRHCGRIVITTESLTDRDPVLVGKFSALNTPPGGFDSLILKSYSV